MQKCYLPKDFENMRRRAFWNKVKMFAGVIVFGLCFWGFICVLSMAAYVFAPEAAGW